MNREKGFSLIELMIVVALMGILAGIASYGWQRYTLNANLRAAGRDLAADFFSAREKAMSENTNYTITFDTGANNYTIAGTSTQIKTPTALGSDVTIQSTTFPGGFVIFLPRGTLGSATGTVTLANSRGSTAAVRVNITGKTYVTFAMQ